MATVHLLTWNIQNFGPTKSGLSYNNYDVARAIAKQVVDAGADIFCLLELNTTKNATALGVAGILQVALQNYADDLGRDEWNTCVLSPNTGKEFYAFFVRDTAFTIPMPVTGPVDMLGDPPALLGAATALTAAVFTGNTGHGVVAPRFPLLVPDQPRATYRGRNLGTPAWPAVRRPVLGMFWVPTAAAGNRLLPIWACHFAADQGPATAQLVTMPFFSLLRKLTLTGGPPVPLQVDPYATGTPHAVATNEYVVTGDFNVDYVKDPGSYAPLDQPAPHQLDASACIGQPTLLVTCGSYSARNMKATGALAVSAYDNFFIRVSATTAFPVAAANSAVPDVPGGVRARRLKLGASVRHYAELDKRGFTASRPYQEFLVNYTSQLAGDPSHLINVMGALVGGRLISDHLPVSIDITL